MGFCTQIPDAIQGADSNDIRIVEVSCVTADNASLLLCFSVRVRVVFFNAKAAVRAIQTDQ